MASTEKFPDAHLLRQSWDSSPPASAVPRAPLRVTLPAQCPSSNKRLPSPQLNDHDPFLNEFTSDQLTELKAILRKRDLLVDKRVNLNLLKRNCIPHRNHNREALKTCQDAGKSWRASVRSGQVNSDSFSVLENALEQLEKSYPGLLGIEEQVRQAENELNNLENHLQQRERKLYNKLKKLIGTHTSTDSVTSDSESRSAQSKLSTEASSSPPLAREYYSQARQAFILRGRLRDFQEEHRQMVEARKRDQDLSQPVEPSEKPFLKTYFTELTTMYKEFYNARERAAQLKAQCHRLGIEVEDEQDAVSNVDALNGQTRVERSVIHQAAMRESDFRGVTALEKLLFGYTDRNARVEEWRANLPPHYQQDESTNINLDNHREFLWDTIGHSTNPVSGFQDIVAQPISPGITQNGHFECFETTPEASVIWDYTNHSRTLEDARFPGDPPTRRYSCSIPPALDTPFNDCLMEVTTTSKTKSIR